MSRNVKSEAAAWKQSLGIYSDRIFDANTTSPQVYMVPPAISGHSHGTFVAALQVSAATASAQTDLLSAIRQLSSEIRVLRGEIATMRAQQEQVVEYRDISEADAIREISTLLQSEGDLYPSEISERLAIDYEAVELALEALRRRGRVA